jgi:hypothetical protein
VEIEGQTMIHIDLELQRVTKTGRETERGKEGKRQAIVLIETRKEGGRQLSCMNEGKMEGMRRLCA